MLSWSGIRAALREVLGFVRGYGMSPAVELMPVSQVNDELEQGKENRLATAS